MQQLRLKHKDAEHLLLCKPESSHYEQVINEEATVYKEDGSLLARLVKDAVDPLTCEVAYRALKQVEGALSARASVLGTKLVQRVRSDGSKGKTMIVAPEIVEQARRKGARADFLGYWEKEPRNQFCRQTAWTRENPEVLQAAMPLIRAADCIFKIECPAEWERQHDHVSQAPDFRIGDTPFSTLTVNKNLATTYHRDEGDFRQGFGVMLTLGNFSGGYLCFPEYGVAFDYRPGDIILADVHSIHGNLPMRGSRVVCVLYARQKINQCGSIDEEWERAQGKILAYSKAARLTPEAEQRLIRMLQETVAREPEGSERRERTLQKLQWYSPEAKERRARRRSSPKLQAHRERTERAMRRFLTNAPDALQRRESLNAALRGKRKKATPKITIT